MSLMTSEENEQQIMYIFFYVEKQQELKNVRCKEFKLKSTFVAPVERHRTNNFCWRLSDDISCFVQAFIGSTGKNLSNKEKSV